MGCLHDLRSSTVIKGWFRILASKPFSYFLFHTSKTLLSAKPLNSLSPIGNHLCSAIERFHLAPTNFSAIVYARSGKNDDKGKWMEDDSFLDSGIVDIIPNPP
ncbi:hypothetical protein VNO77_22195 [Canavalia gladiata]|uniref:Uncharacterized protein n=1 Tax=Canavalia gladiata TaxID=3824 RepID=A0AAN9QAT6_CANGL